MPKEPPQPSAQSEFAALLEPRREKPVEGPKTPKPTKTVVPRRKAQTTPPAKRPRGRPGGKGKRVNPAYSPFTVYIPKKLHQETKINLIQSGKGEVSALVEELLEKWNRAQRKTG